MNIILQIFLFKVYPEKKGKQYIPKREYKSGER